MVLSTKASKMTSLHKNKVKKREAYASKRWEEEAFEAGYRAVGWYWPSLAEGQPPVNVQWIRRLNECWAKWFNKKAFKSVPNVSYPVACRRFLRGFCDAANIEVSCDLLLPTAKSVTCIIPARNELDSLLAQLNELSRLPFYEVIVVLNGSTDNSYEAVRKHPIGAKIVHFDASLGYDVGRAVGAKVSASDILLFLDGDMSVRVNLLLPFIYEVERGADVVLNPISSLLPTGDHRDTVSNAKQFLNICLGRRDLESDSLTAVPHTMSRRAVERLGCAVLSVPPVAHQRAIRSGLSVVRSPVAVDVIKLNRIRRDNTGAGNQVEKLILGDHLEALREMMNETGPRLRFPDNMRKRHLIKERKMEVDKSELNYLYL